MVLKDGFVELSGIRLFTRKLIPEGYWNNKKPVVIFLHEGLGSVNRQKDFPEKFIREYSLPVLFMTGRAVGNLHSHQKTRAGLYRKEERYTF